MAILFELWAECRDMDDLQHLAAYFTGYTQTFGDGRTLTWHPLIVGSSTEGRTRGVEAPALVVTCPGLSPRGVRTVADALEVTEAGLRIYHHLAQGPPFRFARADWDPENIPMNELRDYLSVATPGVARLNIPCVIDEPFWAELGEPGGVVPFRSGYMWCPYRGEVYQPLGSNDHPELWRLRAELFPTL